MAYPDRLLADGERVELDPHPDVLLLPALTNRRLSTRHGVLARSGRDVPLAHVTDELERAGG